MLSEVKVSAIDQDVTAEFEDLLSKTLGSDPMLSPVVASVRVVKDMLVKEREAFMAFRGCANDSV